MPFMTQTYRVLIASPSDLPEERLAATEAVNDWNALHSVAESVVLLPVKWETHATPETGVRPQEAVNRQLVDNSDFLIGMFWTKLGTDTGVAASGTVEEIDRFVRAGKPAMLYFSERPVTPSNIDLKQHEKLRDFKAATYKRALVGNFSDLNTLKMTLHKDLTNTVRHLKRTAAMAAEAEAIEAAQVERAEREREDFESLLVKDKFRMFRAPKGIFALSIIPAVPPRKPLRLGPADEQRLQQILVPMRAQYGTLLPFGRSVIVAYPYEQDYPRPEERRPMSVTELTDTGSIYAADNWLYGSFNDEPNYRMHIYQVEVTKAAERYINGLRTLGVDGVLFVGLSMLKAGKFRFALQDHSHYMTDFHRRGSGGEDVKTQSILVTDGADVSSFQKMAHLIEPAWWHMWREAGYPSAGKYTEQGEYLGLSQPS